MTGLDLALLVLGMVLNVEGGCALWRQARKGGR